MLADKKFFIVLVKSMTADRVKLNDYLVLDNKTFLICYNGLRYNLYIDNAICSFDKIIQIRKKHANKYNAVFQQPFYWDNLRDLLLTTNLLTLPQNCIYSIKKEKICLFSLKCMKTIWLFNWMISNTFIEKQQNILKLCNNKRNVIHFNNTHNSMNIFMIISLRLCQSEKINQRLQKLVICFLLIAIVINMHNKTLKKINQEISNKAIFMHEFIRNVMEHHFMQNIARDEQIGWLIQQNHVNKQALINVILEERVNHWNTQMKVKQLMILIRKLRFQLKNLAFIRNSLYTKVKLLSNEIEFCRKKHTKFLIQSSTRICISCQILRTKLEKEYKRKLICQLIAKHLQQQLHDLLKQ